VGADGKDEVLEKRYGGGMTRFWPIALLTFVYVLNFVDRQLVTILAQPMKAELGLSDRALGTLTGVAFALFYTTLGLPIARMAERRSRVGVIAIALALWSAMTALCGLARTFPQLVLARLGVGLGEAGYAPAAQSLIADLVRPERRATALSIFSLGIPIGMLIGAVAGGWLGQLLGWRMAFVLLGAPGILLALVVGLTLREPARGLTDGMPAMTPPPPFSAVVRQLWASPGFAHMAAGAAIASFAGYGLTSFAVPLLMRRYGLPLAEAATGYGVIAGLSIGLGMAAGGWLSDGQARGGAGRVAAGGALVAGILFSAALAAKSPLAFAWSAALPLMGAHLYFGPTYGITVNSVPARARATAIAVLLMAMNAIGLGLGPLTVGAMSDHFARPDDPAYGLVTALRIDVLFYFWAATHFFLAGRALRRAQPQSSAR
jgi:MFS transporter, Spinster family, sphingosine-1-phosphate transporter